MNIAIRLQSWELGSYRFWLLAWTHGADLGEHWWLLGSGTGIWNLVGGSGFWCWRRDSTLLLTLHLRTSTAWKTSCCTSKWSWDALCSVVLVMKSWEKAPQDKICCWMCRPTFKNSLKSPRYPTRASPRQWSSDRAQKSFLPSLNSNLGISAFP